MPIYSHIRSVYGMGSVMSVEGLPKYKLDLVRAGWEGSDTEAVGKYTFFYGKGNENHELRKGFFVLKRII
jgi:hypothetical protein